MAHICVVDDQEIIRDSVTQVLTREDYRVTAFGDPSEALREIKTQHFDLVLADLKMPRMDGMALIRAIRAAGLDTPIIMMTAFASVPTAVEAMKSGAFDYIQKPFEAQALSVLVERAIEHAILTRENEALRATVRDMRCGRELVGSSQAMVVLRSQLEQVAASHATVLVSGESGTGKELVAGTIHRLSPRSERPMLCLNCAALSAALLESELFGHERGAFTGADRTRKGRFELADGGSLLLDEISEMALPLQAKLLRVLQEGEFERVGSSTTRRSDVRVIATTNRDLKKWVSQDKFREDLFYRLNVLPIEVPPLRDRTRDIPDLVTHFLERAASKLGCGPVETEESAMDAMCEYAWPGNVRELENHCERAVTLCSNGRITRELIHPWLLGDTQTVEGLDNLRDGYLLQDMERKLIEKTLSRFKGHRAKSAKALGMGLRTLGMKLKQWREDEEAIRAGRHVGTTSVERLSAV